MNSTKILFIILIGSMAFFTASAQRPDSVHAVFFVEHVLPKKNAQNTISVRQSFPYKQMILPAFLTCYGLVAMKNKGLLRLDYSIKNEVWIEKPHYPVKIDNYFQYAPGFAVYGLNLLGIKGKNNFRDRTILYFLSNGIMGAIVNPLKMATKLPRPDGFGKNAFPSGHTATAFVGAEFLYQEYKDKSPWYGIAGYTMATTVGFLRIYNNRHWMRDVIAGAGIGIASTKLAYWFYPTIKRWFFRDKISKTVIMPAYQNKSVGINLLHQL
jgi:membrane-associated phospholipid phosphatase